MKQKIFRTSFIISIIFIICSCASTKSGSNSKYASKSVIPKITSNNEYDFDISSESIIYTIDISNPEGRAKLNKLSLRQAEELALVEAIMKYKCATLFQPQYTNLTKGRKVLRITIYGFPAVYKKQRNL